MQNYLSIYMENLEEKINNYFKISNRLTDSMLYSLQAGGKRFRPSLIAASAFALQQDPMKFLDFAIAVEFIHTYSLIHDDLPAMDDATIRRGKPSNHIKFGEAIAILAGDGLLTEAFFIISQLDFSSADIKKVLELLSLKSGYRGMCTGQLLDIEYSNKSIDINMLNKVSEFKTSALIEASVVGTAYLSGSKSDFIEPLFNYSRNIGLVFQITDDILDQTGSIKSMGKNIGQDIKNSKTTYPTLLGIDESKKMAMDLYQGAIDSIKIFGDKGKYLNEIATMILERKK